MNRGVLQATHLVFAGTCIGFLMGIASSPVVTIVITFLIGLAGTVTSVLAGIKESPAGKQGSDADAPPKRRPPTETAPVFAMALGILLGVLVGIPVRTHRLLEADVQKEIDIWKTRGLPEDIVVQRLFDLSYPPLNTKPEFIAAITKDRSRDEGALKAAASKECGEILAKIEGGAADIQGIIKGTNQNTLLKRFADLVKEPALLTSLTQAYCRGQ